MDKTNDSNSNIYDYIGTDLAGYPYNRKYPPDTQKYGSHYGGYRTWQQECFFYDFAVQHYFVRFKYNGVNYFIVSWEDCCARTDETWTQVLERFPNGNALIEQLEIEGHKLIDLINLIEEAEVC